jgi:hypothetical protein
MDDQFVAAIVKDHARQAEMRREFRMDGLAPGRWEVTVTAGGFTTEAATVQIEVRIEHAQERAAYAAPSMALLRG